MAGRIPRLAFALLLAAGCAYSVSPSGKLAHRTIAIPTFTNESLEPGLDDAATRAVQQGFLDDNRLKVVDAAHAETVLHGVIKKYERAAFTFDQQERVQEYKVTVTMDLDYVEVSSGKSLWHEPAFSTWASFNPAGTDTSAAKDEDGAKTQALKKASDQIVARTIEGW